MLVMFIASAWWVFLWRMDNGRLQGVVDWGVFVVRENSGRPTVWGVRWNDDVRLFPRYWRWGFDWSRSLGLIHVQVPLWAPFLLAATPAFFLWRGDVRTARRRRAGRCLSCGYDRRGLAPDAKCPECGAVP